MVAASCCRVSEVEEEEDSGRGGANKAPLER